MFSKCTYILSLYLYVCKRKLNTEVNFNNILSPAFSYEIVIRFFFVKLAKRQVVKCCLNRLAGFSASEEKILEYYDVTSSSDKLVDASSGIF